MSKADDELFGLKSSRTGEYLHSKSADEMFEKLGTNKTENVDFISYRGKVNKNVGYLFNKKEKTIILERFNAITMYDLQAINLKVKELRLDRRRR